MAITEKENAFVDQGSTTIGLSQMFNVTASASNPTYLVLSVLDRDEYTAGASGATGSLSGNGHTLALGSIGGDGRGAGIVFTYQASTGRYYNSTYGYLDQLTYTSSASLADLTNLSLYCTNDLALANAYASNAYAMMQLDPAGYLGSATVATQPKFSGSVPAQATPDSIAAVADSFVGQAWNSDGCWVLASTIAAEAGASLPVQTTAVGVPGQANGEWIVAFDGPAGQGGNWQSQVTAGEIIVIGTPGGGGHITTCVSGSGSSALLVDNITYVNGQGQILNSANDGSASDVIVAAPHVASQEWAGVQASSVVIYELDTPIVADDVASATVAAYTAASLASLFSATDPANKAITLWQVYDTASGDALVLNGTDYADHSAASALSVSSLSGLALLAGATATTDTLEVRASNGSYWGDWTSLSVSVTASAAAEPPVVKMQTAAQSWLGGKPVQLALPSGTFSDPQGEKLSYTASLANGQALPGWLVFNSASETFVGIAPTTAQSLSIVVKATDTSGLSVSEAFTATVVGVPVVAAATAAQDWTGGQAVRLVLPANTFSDPQGETLTYTATLANGQALPGWLVFNPASETFTGTAPTTAQSLSIVVKATDSSGLSATDAFTATVLGAPVVAQATPNQVWTEGKAISLALPANTFTDPQNEKLTYAATQSNGQALPSWLVFNAATETFSGTAPASAQSLGITVTATDSSLLSASDTFTASVQPAAVSITPEITVSARTPAQSWTDGQAVNFVLPSNTFTDALGLKMTFAAYEVSGTNVTSWLHFNAASDDFFGTVPATASGTVALAVVATDRNHVTATDLFNVTFASASSHSGVTMPSVPPGALALIGPTQPIGLLMLPT
jgi:hypothetical protein